MLVQGTGRQDPSGAKAKGPRRPADLQGQPVKAEQTVLMCRKSSKRGRQPAPPKGEFLTELKL